MLVLADMGNCFEGIVPATLATASADGIPNVTRISQVHYVDPEHVSISNQFLSKTQRNLAENPRGSLVLIDPLTYDSYKLEIVFERAEKRGPLFDRMHRDIEAIAAITGMTGIFKLRSADVYRVTSVEPERR
jgi:predicted pyridoxine 5'-phosphate oxidase superfamily flavin-nucleotide-binding protein